LAVAALVVVAASGVSAFTTIGPSTPGPDQRFVDGARSMGHVAASEDQQGLLVSAARKLCDRRDSHATAAARRANALSTAELAAVDQAFAGDTSGFTTLAIKTYCPN
jgi:hypothetical protein